MHFNCVFVDLVFKNIFCLLVCKLNTRSFTQARPPVLHNQFLLAFVSAKPSRDESVVDSL
jgi:hypothetical protein